MGWAARIVNGADGWRVAIEGEFERSQIHHLSSLVELGLPEIQKEHRKRIRVNGDFLSWRQVPACEYLAAFELQVDDNCHNVYAFEHGGLTFHVPALAIIRAFFRPSAVLFPVAFAPLSIDLFSFIDWSQTPPAVIVDDDRAARAFGRTLYGVRQAEALRWMQTSLSARACAQSVHTRACSGDIGLDLPKGQASMVFYGLQRGDQVFVTQMSMNAIGVSSDDSITDKAETFYMHTTAEKRVAPNESRTTFTIPARFDGKWQLSEDEWRTVEGLMRPENKRRDTRVNNRAILDAILTKLGSGCAWAHVPVPTECAEISNASTYFHRWHATGRFQRVVEFLTATRGIRPA